MVEQRVQRRLAAIAVADVVGYSRLMEIDEAGTLTALRERRKGILEPMVRAHGGRIVKVMGDGVLVEFTSAVNAVIGALELQTRMAEANAGRPEHLGIILRIGINLGDVIGDSADVYGDGVNIAARLEALAEPGGVCISGKVHDEVRGKIDIGWEDIGAQKLKNIEQPVRIFKSRPMSPAAGTRPALALPEKPSIAVLAFDNLSGDAEQEYFADGMVEEIITALSHMHWLFVIARNSSFTYKGRNVDIKQIGRELGVRYVLEGSVRRAGNKVRITGQLIDASTGAHLWADRFDGGLEDIFDLQDQITASVVGAVAPKLEQAEIDRSRRKPTESLDAYDYYLRGLAAVHHWTREGNDEALSMFRRAIELDPNFASAHGMVARCYSQRKGGGWTTDREYEIAETIRLARRAVELGKDDALALCTAGMGLAFVAGDLDNGVVFIERALALNPNLATAWLFSGWVRGWRGEPEVAIEHLTRAIRMSPNDPQIANAQAAMASAHFLAERYSEARRWAEMAVLDKPNHFIAVCVVTASCALGEWLAEARQSLARLRELDPALRISDLRQLIPFRRLEDHEKFAQGLRVAGLPE